MSDDLRRRILAEIEAQGYGGTKAKQAAERIMGLLLSTDGMTVGAVMAYEQGLADQAVGIAQAVGRLPERRTVAHSRSLVAREEVLDIVKAQAGGEA